MGDGVIATIERDELKRKVDNGERFTLVEVLPPPFYRAGHLPGAIYIPPIQVRQLAARRLPDRNAEIVVYCADAECPTSSLAAEELTAMGYTNVREYIGGKADWVSAGYPLEK